MNVLNKNSNVSWDVVGRVAVAGLLLWASSVAISLVVFWNAAANRRFVWFPIVLIVLAGSYCLIMRRHIPDPSGNARSAWWCAFALAPVVALLGLSLTGWDHVLAGRVVMRGDEYRESALFALCASLVVPAIAGVVEEVSVRGYLQYALATRLSPLGAQVIAGGVFLAMHGAQLLEIKRLTFLVTLAAVCGYLTSRSGRMGPAVFVHSTVNFAMAAVVLFCREGG